MGVFLVLSTAMLAAATITLLHPGTVVDRIWDFKRHEYERMLPFRRVAGLGFLVLGVLMGCAAYGWFAVRRWAWWLAQGLLAVDLLGDGVRLFNGEVAEGFFGIAMVTLLLVYVRSKGVRDVFAAR